MKHRHKVRDTILGSYTRQAAALSAQYNQLTTPDVFPQIESCLPRARALDVGCGNGRDAHWLATQGFVVDALDGAPGMLAQARSQHAHPHVTYHHDTLPELKNIQATGQRYDFILLSAVWMHIEPHQRAQALANLVKLAKPGAHILISLRHGPAPQDRPMFDVSTDELRGLSAPRLLYMEQLAQDNRADQLGRSNVWWENVHLRLPPEHHDGLQTLRNSVLTSRMHSPHKPVMLLAMQQALQAGEHFYPDAGHIAVPLHNFITQWQRLYAHTDPRALKIAPPTTAWQVMRTLHNGPLTHITDPVSGQPLFALGAREDRQKYLSLPIAPAQAMAHHTALVRTGAVAVIDKFLQEKRGLTTEQRQEICQRMHSQPAL